MWEDNLSVDSKSGRSLHTRIHRSVGGSDYVLKSVEKPSPHATVWLLSHFRLFVESVACQSPLSVGFPRQESWNGLLFPAPGDLPNPRVQPHLVEPPGKPFHHVTSCNKSKVFSWVKLLPSRKSGEQNSPGVAQK